MSALTTLHVTTFKISQDAPTHVSAFAKALTRQGATLALPLRPANAGILNLRTVGGAATQWEHDGVPGYMGKSQHFMLTNKDVYIRLHITRAQSRFYKAGSGFLYLKSSPTCPPGSVELATPAGPVVALRGPLQIIGMAEAAEAFKHLYHDRTFIGAGDMKRLGISVSGPSMKSTNTETEVEGVDGNIARIEIRRRTRIMD